MGWLTGWGYRKSHVINPASGAGTNYQVRINVHYGSGIDSGADVYLNSHSRVDFGDVRFTRSDGVTLLDYWMESYAAGDNAVFWVEVADDLSTNPVTIYIYYGKSDATTTSNGDNTFLFFDDFPGTTLDTTKWASYIGSGASISVADSIVTLSKPASTVQVAIWSQNSFSNVRMRCKVYPSALGAYNRCYRWALMSNKTFLGTYLHIDIKGHGWVVDDSDHHYYERFVSSRISVSVSIVQSWRIYETMWLSNAKIIEGYDTTTENTFTTEIPDVSLYANFACGNAAGTPNYAYNLKVDWIFIAKFVDPEPSHGAWGSEETAPITIERFQEEGMDFRDPKFTQFG
jgi:hypothetical protein